MAESSLRRDRGIKKLIYARANVPEYWVVNLEDKSIEVFTAPTSSGYTNAARTQRGASLAPQAYPDVRVEVARIVG